MTMKRILSYLTIPALFLAAASCMPKEEIKFAHEEQAFETRSDRILVEAILPQATAADDEVYIIGDFNGNSDAVGNSAYRLTRSVAIPARWGVYVDPTAFQGGKTLADGFTFYNVQQGIERGPKNEDVLHTLTIGVGEWANVYADKWAKYFAPPEEPEEIVLPEHDGVRVYIIDQTGWDAIALYMWGDVNNFGGNWPGAQVSGTWTAAGQEYKYFEYGDDIFGLNENLIFNNNDNGTQLADYNMTFADGVKDYFLLVTADGVSEADVPGGGGGIVIPAHDGVRVWVDDQTGWDAIALYMWGDVNNFGGNWPGMAVGGSETLGGVEYKYFEYGDDIYGLNENLIFNNNDNGTQLADFNLTFEDGVQDYFFQVTADGATLIDSPGGGGGVTPPQPEPEAVDGPKIYIKNSTTWGGNLFAHYWGASGTEWPGTQFEETVTVGEEEFLVISTLHKDIATEVGIIFHSDVDDATNRYETTLLLDTDRYYELTNDGLAEMDMGMRLWVKNESRWPGNLFAHIWAPAEEGLSTEWPGIAAVPGYADGKTYDVILVPNTFKGKDVEVIFHDDADADNNRFQAPMNLSQDEFYVLSIQYALDPEEKEPVTVYVIDQTGWDEIALYMWGDINNLGGGWPGIQVSRTETVGKTTLKVFEIPNALTRNENLIFNNNGNGSQLGDFNLTFEQTEYYLIVTAEGVEITERPQAAVPKVTFFVEDQTGWAEGLALYQWGDVNNLGGGWPGSQAICTVTIAGTDYKVFVFEDATGLNQNLIFNNNGNGTQHGDYALKLDAPQYFLTVTAEGVTAKEAPNAAVIFANDQTGWDALALYQWGDVNNLGGDWPGAQVSTTATVGGKDCKVFVVEGAAGLSQNLIFNNNNGGSQLGDYAVKFEKVPYFLTVTAEGVDEF